MNTQTNNRVADEVGKRIAQRLSEGAEDLPHDISERLRAARAQAVANRRIASAQTATQVSLSGGEASLHFRSDEGGWLSRIASLLPLIALIVGLLGIGVLQDEMRAKELAEVDAELLTDELPPTAYTDPGFVQFLRLNQRN